MTEAQTQTVLQMGMTNYQPLRSIRTMWRRFRPMWSDVVISRTVFRHNAFSIEITKIFIQTKRTVTCLRSIDKKSK